MATTLSRGKWIRAKHLERLSQEIVKAACTPNGRLLVCMPPRSGKSEAISRYTPTWYLSRWPKNRVILGSYGANLADGYGRMNRNQIAEHGPSLGVMLSPDSRRIDQWTTTAGGGMVSIGRGGSATGKGANLLLIDDPLKDAEEASSETIREGLWAWFQSTAYTRLQPGASIIIVHTRWHEDDLIGRILRQMESGGEQWTFLNLTAISEEGDQLGRRPGEALWPEMFPVKELERIKKAIGSYFWNALYMGRPSALAGNIFKRSWWKYYREVPTDANGKLAFQTILQSWDMAFKDSKGGSYVTGQVWGKTGSSYYLLDQIRAQMEFTETVQAFLTLTAKWPQATAKLVEDKANGPAIISQLRGRIHGIVAVPPKGSKEARAQAVSPLVEAGNVYLPHKDIAPWIDAYVEELSAFPRGANDDQVDATSQALQRLSGGGFIREVRM